MIHAHRHSRLRHVLGAPALPFLLTGRVLRKALRADIPAAVILRGILPLVALTTAWSAGELIGALQGVPPSS